MSRSASNEIKPLTAAITVGLSVFIGTMSIFVAILAFAVAGRQDHPHAGLGINWSNSSATSIAYIVASASLFNVLIAFGRARLHPFITAFSTIVFIITALLVNVLFVRAW